MDLDKALQTISELENEIAVLKKSLSIQTSKTNNLDEKVSGFLGTIREQKKEVDRLNASVNGLGQFDSTITQLRVDFTRRMEEYEKRRLTDDKMRENLWRDEANGLNLAIEKLKQELAKDVDNKLKSSVDEIDRVLKHTKEIQTSTEQSLKSDEEAKGNINLLLQELKQLQKRMDNNSNEMENMRKRQDGIREKQDIILGDLRTNDSRLNEIITTESERKQTYINFVEQQTLTQRERDRIWNEWQQQFDDSIKQIYKLIPDLQNQQIELAKTKNTFEEVTKNFERRINEVTELYRLMDEKFRQEWATYKSDSEKKWSNISIVLEEKQTNLTEQLEKIKERMLTVEDGTHEMQEALLLMSKEIQKGMQGLMNMVNGWLDAFGQKKSSKNLNG